MISPVPLRKLGGLLSCACFVFLSVACLAADTPQVMAEKYALQLTSPDKNVRREAAYQLGKLGADAKPALPALITAIADADKQVMTSSLAAIANIGPGATEAIPALLASADPPKVPGGRERDRAQANLRIALALTQIGPAALPALIAALGEDSVPRKAVAARALGDLGPVAVEAVPALVKNVGHWDAAVHREVIDALGQMGAPAVQPLIGELTSKDERARGASAEALGLIGKPASPAFPALINLLKTEPKPTIRASVLAALPRVGGPAEPTIAALIEGVRSEDGDERHAAINGLVTSRAVAEQAVPALVAELKAPELPRRQRAALVLGRMGERAAKAAPSLIECARKETGEVAYTDALSQIGQAAIQPLVDELSRKGDSNQRAWIFRAFGGMGSPALAALGAALKSTSPSIRAGAAFALGNMSVDSPETIRSLVAMASDPDPGARSAALRALPTIRSERETTLPKLESALTDSDPQVRKAAAAGLARLGAVSKLGVNGLLDLLDDPELATQRSAIAALGTLGPVAAPAVPALLQKLENKDLTVTALESLGKVGAAAAPALPQLIKYAETGSDDLRVAAFIALNNIGDAATPALPVFYSSLKNDNRDIRIQAIQGLAKIEKDDEKLLPVLLKAFDENLGAAKRAAAVGLRRFGDRAQPAVPGLFDMLARDNDRGTALGTLKEMRIQSVSLLLAKLDDKQPMVRALACEALGKLGPEAREALPALQRRADEDADPVRSAAKKAIGQINKPS